MSFTSPRKVRAGGTIGMLILCAGPCFADGQAYAPGNVFEAGAEARPLAMGGALTAVVHDVSSLYYNPAGLGLLPGSEASLSHAELFGGASYDYLAYARNYKNVPGGWGMEILKFGVSGASGRDSLNNPTASFGYSETGFGFGTGYRGILLPLLSLGVRAKMLQRNLAGSADTLMGLDVGGQYGPIFSDRFSIGFTLENALHLSKGDTTDSLQPLMRVGAGYRIAGPLLLTADVSNGGEIRAGTEYTLGIMALRAGMQQSGFTFGGGFLLKGTYSLDLAVLSEPVAGMSQRVSLGYKFGSGKGDKAKSFAQEYLNDGIAELDKRNYIKAARDLETALGIDPVVGVTGWSGKTHKLRSLIREIGLEQHPEMVEVLRRPDIQARMGHEAIMAYLEQDDLRAMLMAHVAYGQDVHEPAYHELLYSMSRLTRMDVKKEDILPPGALVERWLNDSVRLVYARRYDQATRALKEVLVLDPSSVMAWTRLGSAYFASGNKAEAKAAYEKALSLNPNNEKLRQFMSQQGMQ